MLKRRGAAALALTLLAGAATSTVAASAASVDAPAAVPTTAAGDDAFEPVDFFSDFFDRAVDDPDSPGDLRQRLVPGSPADAFVTYLLGFAAARLESRQGPLEEFTVEPALTPVLGEPAVDVCSEGFCDQFSGFDVVDGRLRSFELNGLPIDDRLAAPTKPAAGATAVRVVGGFERITVDELAVVVAIAAEEELAVAWDEVEYSNPNGVDITVDLFASAYPPVIPAGGEHEVVLQFPTGDLGGQLVIPYTRPSSEVRQHVRVTVEPLQS